jgi:chromate reductase, NAD(P)H dehydrogenase (quinone)
MEKLRVLGVNGSLRKNSSSHVVMDEIEQLLSPKVSFDYCDYLADIPAFDGRPEDPQPVTNFKEQLNLADGVIMVTPEYAFGVPGALKNALDWTVGSGDFLNKPVALVTASSLGEKAHESLQHTLTALSAHLDPSTSLLISFIRAKVSEGRISDHKTRLAIENVVQSFLNLLHKK